MKTKVALVQYPIHKYSSFESWQQNIEKWFLKAYQSAANFICFPEYGSMDLAGLLPEDTQKDLQGQIVAMQDFLSEFISTFETFSKKYNVVVIAPSFPVFQNDKFVNRVFVFSPIKGLVGFQDKIFMTRFESEEWGISSNGNHLSVFESEFGNFGIQICYDNEFYLASHELVKNGVDIIFAPSCTETLRGASRVHIGARTRAMENQCYTCVSQTVLNAEWSPAVDINFGYAACYATPDLGFPETGILSESIHNKELLHIQELDLSLLQNVKEHGQVFNYKDSLRIKGMLDQQDFEVKRVKL